MIKAVTEHPGLAQGGIPLGVTVIAAECAGLSVRHLWKKGKDICRKVFCCDGPAVTVWLADPAASGIWQGMTWSSVRCLWWRPHGTWNRSGARAHRSTTGGTDMLAALLHMQMASSIPMVRLIQVIDAADRAERDCHLFGWKSGLYAIIAIASCHQSVGSHTGRISDVSRAVYILSDEERRRLQTGYHDRRLDRGVTGLQAKGMYTRQEKCMLLCVVSRQADCLAEGDRP